MGIATLHPSYRAMNDPVGQAATLLLLATAFEIPGARIDLLDAIPIFVISDARWLATHASLHLLGTCLGRLHLHAFLETRDLFPVLVHEGTPVSGDAQLQSRRLPVWFGMLRFFCNNLGIHKSHRQTQNNHQAISTEFVMHDFLP